jgi:hypothetical protein
VLKNCVKKLNQFCVKSENKFVLNKKKSDTSALYLL